MTVRNILIADDDAEDTEFFKMAMNQIDPDIMITSAASKDELFENLNNAVPDILFLDSIILTDSGVDCMIEILNSPRYSNMPIIMYTGSDDLKYVSNALKKGASGYIVKPHTLAEVKSVLRDTLQNDWTRPGLKKYYLNGKFHEFEQPEK